MKVRTVILLGGAILLSREALKIKNARDKACGHFTIDGAQEYDPLAEKLKHFLYNRIMPPMPFTGFCEITGCKVEFHATDADNYQCAVTNHLSTAH